MKKVLFVIVFLLLIISYSSSAQRGWVIQNSGVTYDLYDVSFVDELNGWAVGESNMIVHTSDGGITWLPQTSGASQVSRFWAVDFTSSDNGWAGDILASGLYHTTDGGGSWTVVDMSPSFTFYSIYFLNSTFGWTGGWAGMMLRTADGGSTWQHLNTETSQNINAICFVDENTGWVAGAMGTVLHTTDGGATWVGQDAGTTFFIYGIWFIDAQTGWVGVTDGTIRKTTDGGNTWQLIYQIEQSILDIWFADAQKGWATAGPYILHTENGGQDWVTQPTGDNRELWRLSFINDHTGWAVGVGGKIVSTTDGGASTGDEMRKSTVRLQNNPNPFTERTTISYNVPDNCHVRLCVYDHNGREIVTLVDEEQQKGIHYLVWNGIPASGDMMKEGIYLYSITMTGASFSLSESVKMLMVH